MRSFFLVPFFQLVTIFVKDNLKKYNIIIIMVRRVKNEMKDWPDGWSFFPDDELVIAVVEDLDDESFVFTIDLKKGTYPFRPPNVLCNNKEIISCYSEMFGVGMEMQNDLMKLSNKNCWCCDSLLCKNNWNVHNKLVDIVDEFKFFYTIKKRAVERHWAKIISRDCLVEDIPLAEYL